MVMVSNGIASPLQPRKQANQLSSLKFIQVLTLLLVLSFGINNVLFSSCSSLGLENVDFNTPFIMPTAVVGNQTFLLPTIGRHRPLLHIVSAFTTSRGLEASTMLATLAKEKYEGEVTIFMVYEATEDEETLAHRKVVLQELKQFVLESNLKGKVLEFEIMESLSLNCFKPKLLQDALFHLGDSRPRVLMWADDTTIFPSNPEHMARLMIKEGIDFAGNYGPHGMLEKVSPQTPDYLGLTAKEFAGRKQVSSATFLLNMMNTDAVDAILNPWVACANRACRSCMAPMGTSQPASYRQDQSVLGFLVYDWKLNHGGHVSLANSTVFPFRSLAKRRNSLQTDIVHIVHSRFMQNQSHLVQLGLARLELLKKFNFMSLAQQTSENFLWVIRTDPQLRPKVIQPFLLALDKFPRNFLVIGDNREVDVQVDEILKLESSQVIAGDLLWAKNYVRGVHNTTNKGHPIRNEATFSRGTPSKKIVIETRLDSDDGLRNDFVEKLQEKMHAETRHEIWQRSSVWKLLCASSVVEWQAYSRNSSSAHANEEAFEGGVLLSWMKEDCVSTGQSLVYREGLHRSDLPSLDPKGLKERLVPCNEKNRVKCLEFIDLFPSSLRARTPTSQEMNQILGSDAEYSKKAEKELSIEFQNRLWNVTSVRFGFQREHALELGEYFRKHLYDIAHENLRAQCTPGNPCDETIKERLQEIMERAKKDMR